MFKRIFVVVFVIGLLAGFAGLTLQAFAQSPQQPASQTVAAGYEPVESGDDGMYTQAIPPADLWEVEYHAKQRQAHAVRELARVQAVIDHLHAHNTFPPRTQPFDAAQQVVMDYIRTNYRVPTNAEQVNRPVQAVLDYIKMNHAFPPRTDPLDAAVQDVMDYIRINNRVPSSANSIP